LKWNRKLNNFLRSAGLDAVQAKKECKEILASAGVPKEAVKGLQRVRAMLEIFPNMHDLKLTELILLEKTRQKSKMFESWLDLSKEFPDCYLSQRYCVRWFFREHKVKEAIAYIDSKFSGNFLSAAEVQQCALLYEEIKEHEMSDSLLSKGMKKFPDNIGLRTILARNHVQRGDIVRALECMLPISEEKELPPSAKALQHKLSASIQVLDQIAPSDWRNHKNTSILAYHMAILIFKDRKLKTQLPGQLGSTSLFTGSLAAGGAERQMVNTAVNLLKQQSANKVVSGAKLVGPFEILVTTLDSSAGKDFYLSVAQAGNVTVRQSQNITPSELDEICPDNEMLSTLLAVLPRIPMFGVQRLVSYFREAKTEVAYLWQDGAVLQGALAALIAEVPKIIVNMRGLPPNLRPHLFREEYYGMYRALAKIPGVQFASNGYITALAYSEWLDIPVDRFVIVPNGVAKMVEKKSVDDEEMWQDFNNRTADATHTVGSVFRFDTDKRPLLWVLFAREYLFKHPDARFVLVGGGRLLEEAKERAQKFGIDHRVLFVGASTNVPFWLKKIDVFLLLSRYEGLPNVLIEAQMMGVAVVSTPAGNANETFLEGETGFILSELVSPTTKEMCEKVQDLLKLVRSNKELSKIAKEFAKSKFSIQSMIENTVALLIKT